MFDHIPTVGQSFKILVAFSTAVIECQCPDKVVLTLHGKGRATVCPACGKAYGIAKSGSLNIGEISTASGALVTS